MVPFHERELASQVALTHQAAHSDVLAADEPVAGHLGAVLLGGEHRQVFPAGHDINQPDPGTEAKLPADQVEAIVLVLVEGAGIFLPEPLAVAVGVV
jgi:hypothetical protein